MLVELFNTNQKKKKKRKEKRRKENPGKGQPILLLLSISTVEDTGVRVDSIPHIHHSYLQEMQSGPPWVQSFLSLLSLVGYGGRKHMYMCNINTLVSSWDGG